jgi:hypothetical protein
VVLVVALGLGATRGPASGVDDRPPPAYEQAVQAAVVKSDFSGDGKADVLAVENDGPRSHGVLWLYPGSGAGRLLPRELIGIGWKVMTALIPVGDWNGDGTADLLARDSGGTLWLYPGRAHSQFGTRAVIGIGWNGMASILGPGDFNGDRHPDVIARDTRGQLWLYPGNGVGGWLPRILIGIGWGGMTAMVGPGDFDSDGHVDLIARDENWLWLYRGDGAAAFLLPRQQFARGGWDRLTALTGPGDFSGDSFVDLLARMPTGDLAMYRGNGPATWLSPPLLVGIRWNGMSRIVS